MHSDRDTPAVRPMHCVIGSLASLALASCMFDPSATGSPQNRADLVTNEPCVDAGSGDASPGARANIGDGRRAARGGDTTGGVAGTTRVGESPVSAGAAGAGGGDEDAGEDDAGSDLGAVDASQPGPDAGAPVGADAAVDAAVATDADAADAGPPREPPTSEDRRFALDMLEVVVDTLQSHPDANPGNLLGTLAGDVKPDAQLVTQFLVFVNAAENCDDRRAPCAEACTVVAERCELCTPDPECATALNDACGRDRRCW